MITGINALERLSIRVSENPGKDIRDVIKQNDIMSIKTSPNSGVKGLIFHALTGRTYEGRGREYLYGEGESTSSRQAEKIQTTKDREAQAKREGVLSGKRSASKAGIHNRPKLKVTPFKKVIPLFGLIKITIFLLTLSVLNLVKPLMVNAMLK